MAEKRGSIEYRDDGTNAQLVTAETVIEGSEVNVPVDIQSRYATPIQTHNAVSVGASGFSAGSFLSLDGFDKIGINLKNDAATNSQVDIEWSVDGTTVSGKETVLAVATSSLRAGITDTKAPYGRVVVVNTDASAHTMTAYAYLKA